MKKKVLKSEELDQRTKLQIFGKKRHADVISGRLPCPTCPDRPPNGLHGDMINLKQWTEKVQNCLVATPRRMEEPGTYACTVCEMILHLEDQTEEKLEL